MAARGVAARAEVEVAGLAVNPGAGAGAVRIARADGVSVGGVDLLRRLALAMSRVHPPGLARVQSLLTVLAVAVSQLTESMVMLRRIGLAVVVYPQIVWRRE